MTYRVRLPHRDLGCMRGHAYPCLCTELGGGKAYGWVPSEGRPQILQTPPELWTPHNDQPCILLSVLVHPAGRCWRIQLLSHQEPPPEKVSNWQVNKGSYLSFCFTEDVLSEVIMDLVLVWEWVGGEMLSMGRGVGGEGRGWGREEVEADQGYGEKNCLKRKLISLVGLRRSFTNHNVDLAHFVTTAIFSLSPPLYIQNWHWSCILCLMCAQCGCSHTNMWRGKICHHHPLNCSLIAELEN